MRVSFVVGWLGHQSATTTTLWLAHEGRRRGHDVAFVDYLDFSFDADGRVWGLAQRPELPARASRERLADALRLGQLARAPRCLSDEDVVFLRNNPLDRFSSWGEKVGNPGIGFGRVLKRQGVRVLNDPEGLDRARQPMYLLERVPELMPRSFLSRDTEAIVAFLRELDAPAVLKPMAGYGGFGVFHVARGQVRNVRSAVEMLAQQGYVVAQQWVDGAEEGDKRVLLWRGAPLDFEGGLRSVYLRRSAHGDHRHNLHAGGHRRRCGLDDAELALCHRVGALLAEDGLDLVGLDLVGGRLLEANVFSPGGIHNMHALYGINVAARIWESLETGAEGEGAR